MRTKEINNLYSSSNNFRAVYIRIVIWEVCVVDMRNPYKTA